MPELQGEATVGALFIQVGKKYCSFAIMDDAAQSLKDLAYYTAGNINESCFVELTDLHPELNTDFKKVVICYDLPFSFNTALETVVLVEGYDIPPSLHQWLSNKFKMASFIHQGVVLNKKNALPDTGGLLLVDFRENDFFVLVAKEGEIILTQVYEYSTPADVLFYLLKLCKTFSLQQSEVGLQLSGLIDKDSTLYKELYQYFINISFRDATWQAPANVYPAHFFTSLNDLVLCAS